MRQGLTIGLAIAATAICYPFVSARSLKSEPAAYAEARSLGDQPASAAVKPASDIVATVRQMGLVPTSEVLRRGPNYVLHALDQRGTELRVVADAYFGDILSVRPAQPCNVGPDYVREPRIIQVPLPDDKGDTRQGALSPRARTDGSPPLPRPRVAPPTDAKLTPIRPTPKFSAEPAENTAAPKAAPGGG